MPRIDPLQLLNCLNVLLTPSGGIKSELEVARISSLMEKFSKKLVSKCVYLLILKSSDIQLLSKFMGLGGWNLIYNWLLHAVEAKNFPFLIELLEVIVICPVDIERLKSNPMPRQIKCLSKDFTVHPRVRDLASEIVKQWLAIVKGPAAAAAAPAVDPAPAAAAVNVAAEATPVDSGNQVTQPSASSEESVEEDEDDGNYVKSPSPSSTSVDSDDADEFIPNKKPTKRPAKTVNKKEKVPRKKSLENSVEPKLKSKLVASVNAKESKRGSIKLKIEKKTDDEVKPKKEHDDPKAKKEVSVEERLKMKRKLKEEKEKEKFAKFKQVRDKKDKTKDKRDDVVKDKAREDKAREDKYRNELSKLIPKSLDKIGRIPKKPKESVSDEQPPESKAKDEVKPKSIDKVPKKEDKVSTKPKEAIDASKKAKEVKKALPVPPKKPVSMSVEKRFAAEEKPKTVKAYNSKFRLTGLEQEVLPKPPARKTPPGIGSASTSMTPPYEPEATPASPPVEKSALKRSPTKDIEIEPAEKKLKSPDVSMSEDKSSPLSSKNKKPFLQESDFFMNAMTIAIETQKESMRKRKKAPPKSESEAKADENGGRKNSDVASPTIKVEKDIKPAFKFYKETLDTSNDETAHENVEVPDIKIAPEELKTLEDISNVKPKIEPSPPKTAQGLKSALSIFRGKNRPKKSVKWKRDDELEAVQFFEVDASERTNVVRTFWDMQMMERTKERESMLMVRKNVDNDKMVLQTKWKPLTPIDIPASSIVRGANSQEKNIQYARERVAQPAIYFNKSMVPDTPAEPDQENHPVTIPPVIPLDDMSGSQDSITDFSAYKWPEPKLFAPDGSEMGMIAPGFMPNAAGMPQPIFPPFPPPFGQPFFPGAPVPPATWTAASNGDQSQATPNSMPMNWVPPPNMPNMVPPPVGPPGMIAPPPFGMMGPPFPPIPGPGFPAGPNMFPPPAMNQQPMPNNSSGSTAASSDSQSYSNSNNYSTNSESSGGSGSSSSSSRKWSSDDRYSSRKDGWKNNYSDRSRDKRSSSSSWRSSNRDSRLCRTYQKKGYCNVSGCRFYHDDD